MQVRCGRRSNGGGGGMRPVVDRATSVNPAMPPVGWLGGVVGAAPHGVFVEEPQGRFGRLKNEYGSHKIWILAESIRQFRR